MPTLNPDMDPMTVDDLLELETQLALTAGFGKSKTVLSFQQEFFGFMGSALLLRQPKGTFHPMFCTNIPNCEEGQTEEEMEFDLGIEFEEAENEDDFGEDEEQENDDADEAETRIDRGEDSADEFANLASAMIERLAPCFQHEKQSRFFADFRALEEFVSPDLASRFQGYKLVIIPIFAKTQKNVKALVMLYTTDDSQFLLEEDMDNLERIWRAFAYSLKLIER